MALASVVGQQNQFNALLADLMTRRINQENMMRQAQFANLINRMQQMEAQRHAEEEQSRRKKQAMTAKIGSLVGGAALGGLGAALGAGGAGAGAVGIGGMATTPLAIPTLGSTPMFMSMATPLAAQASSAFLPNFLGSMGAGLMGRNY